MTAGSKTPTVHEAWSAVMADVRALAKGDRNAHFGFDFRGIDAVVNAVGPALRTHGVAVVPTHVEAQHRDVRTAKDKPARESTVLVEFTVYGPAGDSFTGMAPGESMDEGDKGTAKAMSVAMRTFLLQALCLPTEETDPDAETYVRAAGAPEPTPAELAQSCADELGKATTADRVRELGNMAHQRGLLDEPVRDAQGRGPLSLRECVNERLAAVEQAADHHNTDQQPADEPAA